MNSKYRIVEVDGEINVERKILFWWRPVTDFTVYPDGGTSGSYPINFKDMEAAKNYIKRFERKPKKVLWIN